MRRSTVLETRILAVCILAVPLGTVLGRCLCASSPVTVKESDRDPHLLMRKALSLAQGSSSWLHSRACPFIQ